MSCVCGVLCARVWCVVIGGCGVCERERDDVCGGVSVCDVCGYACCVHMFK